MDENQIPPLIFPVLSGILRAAYGYPDIHCHGPLQDENLLLPQMTVILYFSLVSTCLWLITIILFRRRLDSRIWPGTNGHFSAGKNKYTLRGMDAAKIPLTEADIILFMEFS